MSTVSEALRNMSATDWLAFGVNDVAYLRPVVIEGKRAFAVHAADGTALTVVPDRDVGYAAILQQEMHPASVH